jgi:hypothetical protein
MEVYDTAGGAMPDQPPDPQPEQPDPASRPPLADAIRQKLDEYDVERHLTEIASTVEGVVRQGMTLIGEFAHEHKDDIDRFLDQAASVVDRHTEGRHAERISQVRGSLDRGVERIAEHCDEHRDESPPDDVPPSNG